VAESVDANYGLNFEPIDTKQLMNFMLRADQRERWKTKEGFNAITQIE